MTLEVFTGWDWFVFGLFALSVGAGLWKGLVRTVFGLAAWLIALICAPLTVPAVIEATGLHNHPWVVLFIVFVVLLVTVRMMGSLLARGLGKVGLGGADRLLGGLLGAARAIVLLAVAVVFARGMGLADTESWRQSFTRPALDGLLHLIEPRLPERAGGVRDT